MCLNFSTCVCLCKLFFCVKQSRSLHGWWVYFNPAERSCVWFVCLPGCLFAFCIWVSEVWSWDVETALSEVTETTDLNSDPHKEISLLLSGISQRSRVTIRASPEDEFIVSHCDSLFVESNLTRFRSQTDRKIAEELGQKISLNTEKDL